jgi:hypothetical protein
MQYINRHGIYDLKKERFRLNVTVIINKMVHIRAIMTGTTRVKILSEFFQDVYTKNSG